MASSIDGDSNGPKEGDVSVCLKCAGFVQFDANLKLEKTPKEVWDNLDLKSKLILLNAISIIKHERKMLMAFDTAKDHGDGSGGGDKSCADLLMDSDVFSKQFDKCAKVAHGLGVCRFCYAHYLIMSGLSHLRDMDVEFETAAKRLIRCVGVTYDIDIEMGAIVLMSGEKPRKKGG